MNQRCLILIDGSNFYFKLKGLGLHNLLQFNFKKFAKFLAKSGKIVGTHYSLGYLLKSDGVFHEKGKLVEYVGFSHRPSVAMVRFCAESRVLAKDDILSFTTATIPYNPEGED